MSPRRLDSRASWTAQVCATQRAAETMQPVGRRRLDDPYSRSFVQHPVLRAALWHPLAARAFIAVLDLQMPDVHAFVVLRVRYVDDIVRAALEDGIDQIVLLGSGFDTTSVRCGDARVTVFEIDAPTTLTAKRDLDATNPRPQKAAEVVWVPCDFEYDRLSTLLLESGYDRTRPSVVVWMGVTMFLTHETISSTLADLSGLCAPQSRLIFDYVDPDVITGESRWPGARRVARAVTRRGEPYRTGLTSADAEQLIAGVGFTADQHLRTPALEQRYAPSQGGSRGRSDWLAVCAATRV